MKTGLSASLWGQKGGLKVKKGGKVKTFFCSLNYLYLLLLAPDSPHSPDSSYWLFFPFKQLNLGTYEFHETKFIIMNTCEWPQI